MQEQEIDCDNPFYVPIPYHLMGATQVLECIASNFDGTVGGRKWRKVDKGKDSKGQKVQNMVLVKVDEDDRTNVLMDNTTMIMHVEAPLDGVVDTFQLVAIVTSPL